MSPTDPRSEPRDFIREIIDEDLAQGRHRKIVTRFPPEPNGFLHIGHAKSICLNFGIARDYGGSCHLRMDDSNPTTEDEAYVRAIHQDVRWLGFEWGEHEYFASDYFERLYQLAEQLIVDGHAYVDSSDEATIRDHRGTVTEAGRPTPFRNRSAEESLDLFRRMRAGEFPDGSHVLRARIDLASPNMKMRDPLLYRIRHAHHYRTGDKWCIYPLYDFVHPLSDALEGITHSICTLEFENNRELYDWVVEHCRVESRPRQYEFARLALTYTVMSKRKLLQLVQDKHVTGWDDPRMPTLAGMRRRGVTAEALRKFCDRIGVAKNNSTVDVALFEHTLREDLSDRSPRMMAVLDPLEIVIENFPAEQAKDLDAPLWPLDMGKPGSRPLPFGDTLYVERDDFAEHPPKGFHRLSPGAEVRLRHGCVIRCDGVDKDDTGRVTRLRCHADFRPDEELSRKIKGTIHWVDKRRAVAIDVALFDRLFNCEQPGAESGDPLTDLNPHSLTEVVAWAEPALAQLPAASHVQLERLGYFFFDEHDGKRRLVRTVPLKDTWAKVKARQEAKPAATRVDKRPELRAEPVRRALSEAAQALVAAHGVTEADARVLADNDDLRAFFLAAKAHHAGAKALASWLVNELPAEHRSQVPDGLRFDARGFAELVAAVEDGTITGAAGKTVLRVMLEQGGQPRDIIDAQGLQQLGDDGALASLVQSVLDKNEDMVARYRAGNAKLLGAFVGLVMRETRGTANPTRVSELLQSALR
ncbi:MAG: glutamine--tRNA ligase/YqeY domain fusion protein [Polyangiaceae bacterium]